MAVAIPAAEAVILAVAIAAAIPTIVAPSLLCGRAVGGAPI